VAIGAEPPGNAALDCAQKKKQVNACRGVAGDRHCQQDGTMPVAVQQEVAMLKSQFFQGPSTLRGRHPGSMASPGSGSQSAAERQFVPCLFALQTAAPLGGL